MARFLLTHGAWQAGWCWQLIVSRLQACGHRAIALDLPGYGADSGRAASATLDDYVACVKETVDACPEPPVLVGHSHGAFISQVAEAIPDRIRCLIFVAAIIPANGCSMMQFVNQLNPEYLAQIQWAPDGRSAKLGPDGARNFLYSECPSAMVDALLPRLEAQSVAPYEYLFSLSEANFGRSARHYVLTLRDRLVPPKLQKEVCAIHSFKNVHPLEADHSPFFSAPDDFAALLHTIAEHP